MFAVYLSLAVLGTAALATIVAFAQIVAEVRPHLVSIVEPATVPRHVPAKPRESARDDLAARRSERQARSAPATPAATAPSARRNAVSAPAAAAHRTATSRW